MTVHQWVEKYLTDRGMFPEDARIVCEIVRNDEINESMIDRWQENIENYPETLQAVLSINIDFLALEWIDANCPKAWYRPMFDTDYV